MSRIGKQPIKIPENVNVDIDGEKIFIKGPLGEMTRFFNLSLIKIEKSKDELKLFPLKKNKNSSALWGTYAAHLRNMIKGVTEGFSKNLIIEGIGYKAQIEGNTLVLSLGFSHPIKILIPEGIKVQVEKNKIEIFGLDKEKVGQFAARIRSLRKPEPYKGKGIRYEDEIIRRKAGKKAVGAV